MCDCPMEISRFVQRGSPELAIENIGRIAADQFFDHRQRKVCLFPGEQYNGVAEPRGREIGRHLKTARRQCFCLGKIFPRNRSIHRAKCGPGPGGPGIAVCIRHRQFVSECAPGVDVGRCKIDGPGECSERRRMVPEEPEREAEFELRKGLVGL